MRRNELVVYTHIIVWMLVGDKRISQKAKKLINDNINSVYYSIASMWEVQIKHNKEKISISGIDFMHYCEQSGYHKLPIDDLHIKELAGLDRDEAAPPHNDPFDRILLSQAKAEGFTFLTHDPYFRGYNEACVVEV